MSGIQEQELGIYDSLIPSSLCSILVQILQIKEGQGGSETSRGNIVKEKLITTKQMTILS